MDPFEDPFADEAPPPKKKAPSPEPAGEAQFRGAETEILARGALKLGGAGAGEREPAGRSGEPEPRALEKMGETAPLAVENLIERPPPELEDLGDLPPPPSFEDLGEPPPLPVEDLAGPPPRTLEHLGETAPLTLEHLGETGPLELKHLGETGPLTLEHLGETGPLHLEHLGETDALADPFASGGGPRLEEPPSEPSSRGPMRRGDNEENVYVVLPDQPEPDSQPAFLRDRSSSATVDLPPTDLAPTAELEPMTDLEALRTPSFVKGGAEGTAVEGEEGYGADSTRDLTPGPMPAVFQADEPTKDESYRGGEGSKEETRDESQGEAATGTLAAAGDEEEPDFLYGARFSDRYKVPEGPPKKPSRLPKIAAISGGALLVVVIVVVIAKFSSGPREFQGVNIPPAPIARTSTGPLPAPPMIRKLPAPPRPAVEKPPATPAVPAAVPVPAQPAADEPPPLPPPADAIDAKLRRALAWGLPIEPAKGAPAAPIKDQPARPQGEGPAAAPPEGRNP